MFQALWIFALHNGPVKTCQSWYEHYVKKTKSYRVNWQFIWFSHNICYVMFQALSFLLLRNGPVKTCQSWYELNPWHGPYFSALWIILSGWEDICGSTSSLFKLARQICILVYPQCVRPMFELCLWFVRSKWWHIISSRQGVSHWMSSGLVNPFSLKQLF